MSGQSTVHGENTNETAGDVEETASRVLSRGRPNAEHTGGFLQVLINELQEPSWDPLLGGEYIKAFTTKMEAHSKSAGAQKRQNF